jgi:hemerythrin-like domain-containing protein
MRRDRRLRALSADHHHALVLARQIERRAGEPLVELIAWVRAAFDADLAPHFEIEERRLLPALLDVGEGEIVARVHAEHATMRAHLAEAERGEARALLAFARLLTEHVHFEERVLFPLCEARLSDEALAQVAAEKRA